MDARCYFLMALHCHQPVGNFGFVFEEAFKKAYEPFLDCLERHPNVRLALHYSGSLLDWLEASQPAFLARLHRLVQRGQVELLASGYYEPILPLIPEADRQGQIALMQQTLARRFGRPSTGLWLTERVWEPELPATLARAGIRYTLLDTNQFQLADRALPSHLRVQDEQGRDLLGCYMTDYAGESVALFPTSQRLRYWIPFQDVSRTIEFLKRLTRTSPLAIAYADDGEKFGLWPKTYAWVYEQGWLERLFTALERESSWLTTATFSRYLEDVGPSGRVYLPCGSYEEMLEWSGGYFRNFFVKYPESNAMQHKMLDVSRQIQEVSSVECRVSSSKGQRMKQQKSSLVTRHSSLIAQAQRELYQAQCNDAYWHGVFGGLYLSHLRRAVYSHLIAAERLIQPTGGRAATSQSRDLDGDGKPEVTLRNQHLSLVVDPDENGAITEIALSRRALNLADTLARRYEPYHEKLKAKQTAPVSGGSGPSSIHDLVGVKEEGLAAYLAYDDHRRSCAIDYALSSMPTAKEIWCSTWGEHRLWSGGPWTLEPEPKRARPSGAPTARLSRRLHDGSLRKTITVAPDAPRFTVRYDVDNLAIPVIGLEWNLSLQDERLRKPSWQEQVRTFAIQDASLGVGLTVTIDPPASLVTFPIETVSESEEGLERTPQGLAVVCLWPTQGRRQWQGELTWTVEEPSCR